MLVTSLGKESIILGPPWLRRTNAKIDWQSGRVTFRDSPPEQAKKPQPTVEDVPDIANLHTLPLEDDDPGVPSELEQLELEPDDLLIAYTRGEPVVGVFGENNEDPLTDEHIPVKSSYSISSAGHITSWKNSPRFSYGKGCWIRAKINPAMEMAQKHTGQTPQTTENTIPPDYQDYRDVFEKKASERFPES